MDWLLFRVLHKVLLFTLRVVSGSFQSTYYRGEGGSWQADLPGAGTGAGQLGKAMAAEAQVSQHQGGAWLTQSSVMVSGQSLSVASQHLFVYVVRSSSLHLGIHHIPILCARCSFGVPHLVLGHITWPRGGQSKQQISWETVIGSGMFAGLGSLIRSKETGIQHFWLSWVGIGLTTLSAPEHALMLWQCESGALSGAWEWNQYRNRHNPRSGERTNANDTVGAVNSELNLHLNCAVMWGHKFPFFLKSLCVEFSVICSRSTDMWDFSSLSVRNPGRGDDKSYGRRETPEK